MSISVDLYKQTKEPEFEKGKEQALEEVRPRKLKKTYKKLMRKQKKERIKWAKEFGVWDWGFLDDIVFGLINQMKDYYELGYNVWQVEESKKEIIGELEEALKLRDAREFAFEEYYKKHPVLEPQEYKDEEGNLCWKFEDNLSEEQQKERNEACKRAIKAEQKAFEESYKFIGKHLRKWWD